MSEILNRLFLQSLLADASYVDLSTVNTSRGNLARTLFESGRYKGEGTGDPNRNRELAEIIEANFDYVIGSQEATFSGFSATLFRRRAHHESKYYIPAAGISEYEEPEGSGRFCKV